MEERGSMHDFSGTLVGPVEWSYIGWDGREWKGRQRVFVEPGERERHGTCLKLIYHLDFANKYFKDTINYELTFFYTQVSTAWIVVTNLSLIVGASRELWIN